MVLMNVDIHHVYGVLRFINTFYQYHKKTNFILNNSNKILVDLHWITLSKKCYPSSATENDLGNHSSTSACQWYEERNWKAIPFINFKVEIEIWFAYILRNQHHLRSAARLSPWLTAVLSMYQWYLTNLIFFTNILYADKNLQSLEEIVNQELCKPCDLLTANKLTFEYKEKFCHILSC